MEKMTIKQWRLVRGFTQKELAKLSGMEFSTYHAKESGYRSWKATELRNVCKALDVSIETQLIY